MTIHRILARLKETAAWPEDFYTRMCRVGKPVKFTESSSVTLRGKYSYKGPDKEHTGDVLMIAKKISEEVCKIYRLHPNGAVDKDLLDAVVATVKATAKKNGVRFLTKGWLDEKPPKVGVAVVKGLINIMYSGSDYPSSTHKEKAVTLTTEDRNGLADSEFGLPDKRAYPMPDAAHAKNAKARAKQMLDKGDLSKADYDKIVRKADSLLGK